MERLVITIYIGILQVLHQSEDISLVCQMLARPWNNQTSTEVGERDINMEIQIAYWFIMKKCGL